MIQNNLIRIIFLTLFFIEPTIAQNVPPKPKTAIFVSDFANLLDNNSRLRLERKLQNYNDSTSTQIAVVIIESLQGANLENYAQELAETWGIGQKGKDNGILLLISKNDRKIRIHTGYGVEDRIPDALAKKIIDNDLKPSFKAGQFYMGIYKATDTMMGVLSGAFLPDELYVDSTGIWLGRLFLYLFLLLILLFILVGLKSESLMMKVFSIIVGISLLSVIFLLELWAYPNKHGWGFWILAGLTELVAWIVFMTILAQIKHIEFRYKAMKKWLESDEIWTKLKRFYKPNEIDEKRAELKEIFLPLRQDFAYKSRIKDLYNDFLRATKEWNNKFYARRNEYDLLMLANDLEKIKFFEQALFEKESLAITKNRLYDTLAYFEPKGFEVLSADDQQKLTKEITYFKQLKDEPEKLLTLNKSWLIQTCQAFLDNPKSWTFSAYTMASINKTKKNFINNYKKVEAKGKALDYYIFYVHKIKKIQDSPGTFLIKKPTPSGSSSTYSSSGSSFSSSSSSSFGGGSFGGGGASGGW